MRRLRHLEHCDYVIPIGQKIDQVLVLNNQHNCYLERSKDKKNNYSLRIHAKFRSDLLNGFAIEAVMLNNGLEASSLVSEIKIYRVNNTTFAKTLLLTKVPSAFGAGWVTNVTQADLATNELSGRETYYIEAVAQRRNKPYRASSYFNHLGCYDSIIRLRRDLEVMQVTKAED